MPLVIAFSLASSSKALPRCSSSDLIPVWRHQVAAIRSAGQVPPWVGVALFYPLSVMRWLSSWITSYVLLNMPVSCLVLVLGRLHDNRFSEKGRLLMWFLAVPSGVTDQQRRCLVAVMHGAT